MKGLSNRIVLITGAGSGIGANAALRFAEEGSKVIIVGRSEGSLKESAAQHENIRYIVADINKADDINKIYTFIDGEYGHLDVLVNNAGVAPVGLLGNIPESDIVSTLNTNIKAVIDLTQALLPLILKVKGNILNIGSANASRPMANMSVYSASKAALVALTRSWAKELAGQGVRVNSVSVGPIWTPIYDKTSLSQEEADKHVETVKKLVPLGRFGTVEEVSSVMAFLASEEAAYVTGSDYAVDGGVGA